MAIIDALVNMVLGPLELIFEIIFMCALKVTHSAGVAVIILSIVVSTLVLPLYKRAEKLEQEQRDKEKKLSHWVNHIKKHFKGDERYMILDAYYRENHYNPLSQLKSSISILLQIPFFMAAFDMLGVRAQDRFYRTSFLIFYDLSVPDGILQFGDITINLLPFLMTIINVLACYIYTKELPFKTAARSYLLALAFLVLLYNSPAALLLYWTCNNLYSLVKTIIIRNYGKPDSVKLKARKAKPEPAPASGPAKWITSVFDKGASNGIFVLAAIYMSVLTGLLIPLSYLSASPEEFVSFIDPQNPLHYLLSSFFVSFGFFVLWPSVFYFLANKKAKVVISMLMFGISVFSTVNFLFFGTDTGTINTTLIFDRAPAHPMSQQIINILVVLAILAACFFLYRFRKALGVIYVAAIMTLLTVSFINAKKVQNSYVAVSEHIDSYQTTIAPKITLSSTGENVMVIMLDKAVSGYIPYIFYEFPEIAEQFDGFVYYPNTASFGQNTLKTSSALFGGYEYTPERMDARPDESLKVKHDESMMVLPKLFSDEGYYTTLMDLPFPGWSWKGDYSAWDDIDNCDAYYAKDFYTSDTEANLNIEKRRNRNLFMYSLFRCAPLCMQSFIYDDGDYLSATEDAFDIYDVLENYKVLENLEEMTVIDNSYTGTLLMFDNETTHDTTTISNYDPYNRCKFEEGDEFYISNGTDELLIYDPIQAGTYECLVASMREVGDYMDYLREIGVYDNTRIIIVSDHGTSVCLFWNLINDDFNAEWYNCLLMVKDFDSTGYTTDYTFMTNADVPTIALEGIVDDPVNPYTGVPIDSSQKYDDLYICYYRSPDERWWNPDLNPGNTFYYDDSYRWYKLINGDIFDQDNWVEVDGPGD